ncbi:RidA family protein [Chloroflexota bacterium]
MENPETGEVITDVEGKTRQCLENIKHILEMANASLNDVVKATVFLGNVADYPKMNAV